jgi:hypothetical protein
MLKFLAKTGNAVRVGILLALVWAGALWGWSKLQERGVAAYQDAYFAERERIGREHGEESSDSGFFVLSDDQSIADLDSWEKANPVPPLPLAFWPGAQWWAVVVGAYVCLVVVVQLSSGRSAQAQ